MAGAIYIATFLVIVNFIFESRSPGYSRPRGLDPLIMPERSTVVLEAALQACRLPLAVPARKIAQIGLCGDGAIYQVGYSVSSNAELAGARTEIYARVQRRLRHAAISLAVPGQPGVLPLAKPTPAELLEQSDLFGSLETEERILLAGYMRQIWLKRGDVMLRQDERPEAMFIIASGTVKMPLLFQRMLRRCDG